MPRRLPGKRTVMFLRQSHFLEDAGGGPVHALVQWRDDLNGCEAFLNPGRYPPFEGDGAWFRLIRHKKGDYTFLERVADAQGAPWSG